ncbi:MAG: Rieske (2Fe-2S) protein [Bacteroidales bacterium]|nr:Rieske (2Fe-2S) protein [Bacteroidales bacterium]MCF8338114.1 Rieske (2Fe-2S) protein [Bacteroidales bacterium]
MRGISRKQFFKQAGNLLLLVFLYFLVKLTGRHQDLSQQKVLKVDKNSLHNGYNFFEDCIIVTDSAGIKVFSSRCTHLGCRIAKAEGSHLVCPCHGSRYNRSGEPISGPAPRPLKNLDYRIEGDKIIIRFV